MNTSWQHILEFTPQEYQHFRTVLKTQVIRKEDKVIGFIVDDMVLEDRGDVLRFKLAYLPPYLRRLDIHVAQTESKITLSWNDPTLPTWYAALSVLSTVLFAAIAVGADLKNASPRTGTFVFLGAFLLWTIFWFWRTKRHLREGAERFAKAMESMSNKARAEIQQSA